MMIDKLNGINPLRNITGAARAERKVNERVTDSVHISSDAKAMGELYQVAEKVRMAPDIRQDRVDEVMKKMEDPNYFSKDKIEAVAAKLVGLYEL